MNSLISCFAAETTFNSGGIKMRITVLSENMTMSDGIESEHGLSLYIETEKHKLLFDMGQGELFLRNAERMGIDIKEVDTAILSHGHYDHGGGLEAFLAVNGKALAFVSENAFGHYLNSDGKYIGLDMSLQKHERIIPVSIKKELDDTLSLYSCNNNTREYKTESYGLGIVENGVLSPDEFLHEQYLLIRENGKRILISGCSHKGVLNILKWFDIDVFVGGFHFMKLDTETADIEVLSGAAKEMLSYPVKYYTGHCTGESQFRYLKSLMGERLDYISAGDTVII